MKFKKVGFPNGWDSQILKFRYVGIPDAWDSQLLNFKELGFPRGWDSPLVKFRMWDSQVGIFLATELKGIGPPATLSCYHTCIVQGDIHRLIIIIVYCTSREWPTKGK